MKDIVVVRFAGKVLQASGWVPHKISGAETCPRVRVTPSLLNVPRLCFTYMRAYASLQGVHSAPPLTHVKELFTS